MSKHSLPCIKCEKPLINVDEGCDNAPYVGTEFTTLGHYGSTVHDEIWPPLMELVVNLCDTCIVRAVDAGVIQSRSADGSIALARHSLTNEQRAWVLAQNEAQYGSAWGDDTPQDYRARMIEAGWSAELLDRE